MGSQRVGHNWVTFKVYYGLWMIKMLSVQVHQLQQIYHSDEDVNKEGDYECAVAGVIWEISETFIQFCCESKMALKNKVH